MTPPGPGKILEKGASLDGSRETLVSLGVVVLESDLELNGLDEVPLLLTCS